MINFMVNGKIKIDFLDLPALLAPVDPHWVYSAFRYLGQGNEKLYYYTNANIGLVLDLLVEKIYFKMKNDDAVCVVADFIDLQTENPAEFRLPEHKNKKARYYYGFKNIKYLERPIRLEKLEYFQTGTNLRNDVPGACIIRDFVLSKE